MLKINFIEKCFFLYLLGISLNQPNFSSCAIWNTNAITLANETLIGQQPTGLFINIENNIYITDQQNSHILIGYNGSLTLKKTISGNLSNPWSLFVTDDGDIFVDNGYKNNRVDKWALNGTNGKPAMHINSSCTGLFVDTTYSLYCSSTKEHSVFKVGIDRKYKHTDGCGWHWMSWTLNEHA